MAYRLLFFYLDVTSVNSIYAYKRHDKRDQLSIFLLLFCQILVVTFLHMYFMGQFRLNLLE